MFERCCSNKRFEPTLGKWSNICHLPLRNAKAVRNFTKSKIHHSSCRAHWSSKLVKSGVYMTKYSLCARSERYNKHCTCCWQTSVANAAFAMAEQHNLQRHWSVAAMTGNDSWKLLWPASATNVTQFREDLHTKSSLTSANLAHLWKSSVVRIRKAWLEAIFATSNSQQHVRPY